jgi:hypothetical protein
MCAYWREHATCWKRGRDKMCSPEDYCMLLEFAGMWFIWYNCLLADFVVYLFFVDQCTAFLPTLMGTLP